MRIKEFSKKLLAYACVATLAIGSLAGYSASTVEAAEVPDIILDGDEGTHESALIGEFAGTPDEYRYAGWATFKDAKEFCNADETENQYKYLIMTYTGDIEFLRFEFTRIVDEAAGTLEKHVVWFNPNQASHFVTYDGTDIPFDTVSTEKTTLVLDLSKVIAAGYEVLSWYNDGIHIHTGAGDKTAEGFREAGSFKITSARLSTSPEVIADDSVDHDFVVTPGGTEDPTETPTTKPTVKPTTPSTTVVKAPKKATISKVYPKKKSAKKVKLTIKKIKSVKGYEVQVSKAKKFKKKNILAKKTSTKNKVTVKSKKLKNKKKLYVRARAYRLNGKTKVYGKWSKVKQVKIKK